MRSVSFVLVAAAAAAIMSPSMSRAADDIEYRSDLSFGQFPPDAERGAVSGAAVDSKGQVYVLQRAKPPVLCFDSKGKFQRSFGEDLIGVGHGISIDPEDNVWVTDTDNHMVFKFSPTGKTLLAIGKPKVAGTDDGLFDKPTYVAFGRDGDIFIMDGYGNSRIVRINANGKFEKVWGQKGSGPGEFNAPHAAVVDRRGRLIVCDRDNLRIQVFDREGTLLDTWTGFKPFGIAQDGEGTLFMSSSEGANQKQYVAQLTPEGKIVKTWGKWGDGALEFKTPHLIAADRQGNIYVAEVGGKRLQKLERVR